MRLTKAFLILSIMIPWAQLVVAQSPANLCTLDSAPGATLLYPYFEVDVSDTACSSNGPLTTEISVRNEKSVPALLFVTVWSDWAVPVLGFHVYLAGQDTQTVDLKDIFCSGNLPSTGSATSNHGDFSDSPRAFPGCNDTTLPGDAPVYPPGVITGSQTEHLRAYLTGQQSQLSGDCAANSYGDQIARGYVTADVVTACHGNLPSDSEYYLNGYLSLDNQLTGYFDLRDDGGFGLQSYSAVSLQANASLTGILGGPTFYGRYNSNLVGFEYSDGREPLPTTYGGRWSGPGGYGSNTLIVWRESGNSAQAVACGSAPAWWPLDLSSGDNAVTHFDDNSDAFVPITIPGLPPPPWFEFPSATQRVSSSPPGGSPFSLGWNYLNLKNSEAPGHSASLGQGVVMLQGAQTGPNDRGYAATVLDGQCPATTVFPPPEPLDPTAWSGFLLFKDSFE